MSSSTSAPYVGSNCRRGRRIRTTCSCAISWTSPSVPSCPALSVASRRLDRRCCARIWLNIRTSVTHVASAGNCSKLEVWDFYKHGGSIFYCGLKCFVVPFEQMRGILFSTNPWWNQFIFHVEKWNSFALRSSHWYTVHYSDVMISAMASQISGISVVYSTICSGEG